MSKIVSEVRKAYIITGPTSGAGRATALEMVKHGTLVRVGRNGGIEPGIMFNTGLHGHMNIFFYILAYYVVPLLAPYIKVLSTPKRAARVFTKILLDTSGRTGVYYDESGHPMQGSPLVRDPNFRDRVVAETRVLLSTISN